MKQIGLARLGRDAELRRTAGGEAVCNLSLAVNYGQKDSSGNRPTQWIDATLWGKRAEALAQYLVKGSVHCFTLDEVHIEEFEGRNGRGVKLAARVLDVELGPRVGGDGQRQAPARNEPAMSGRQSAASAATATGGSAAASAPQQQDVPFDDSDIPFN